MRNRNAVLLGISLAVLAASSVAADRLKPRAEADRRAQAFAVSGEFSGALAGSISLNGERFQLAHDVRIYEIGRGVLPPGTTVYGRMLSLSGVYRESLGVIHQIIVRPDAFGGVRRITEADDEARPE